MTSIGGILAPVGFARSLVSAIFNQSSRSILWEVDAPASSTGGPTPAPTQYALGGYVPILEEHNDTLNITEHPVEQGAEITDHAYKMPAQLALRIGWSAASPAGNPIQGSSIGNISLPTLAGFWALDNSSARLNALYGTLLSVQINRNLLTVTTARRLYKNLLLKALSLTTDDKTSNVVLVTCTLQEVILVNTQVVKVPVNNANNTDPQSNNAITPQGQRSLATPVAGPAVVVQT